MFSNIVTKKKKSITPQKTAGQLPFSNYDLQRQMRLTPLACALKNMMGIWKRMPPDLKARIACRAVQAKVVQHAPTSSPDAIKKWFERLPTKTKVQVLRVGYPCLSILLDSIEEKLQNKNK